MAKQIRLEHSFKIKSMVECPYNTGSHGKRCKASHSSIDSIGRNIPCPYNFIIPDSLEHI